MSTRNLWLPLVVFGCFASLVSAQTQTLFGVTGQNGAESFLYTINTTTGATTLVGDTGFTGVGSLAFATNGTTLYGVSGNASSGSPGHYLITINTITGLGTKVSNNLTGTGNIADIAFRSDGVLFAAGGMGTLYTINTTTGVATTVGIMPDEGSGNALAFNASGTLYLCADADPLHRGYHHRCNNATGAVGHRRYLRWNEVPARHRDPVPRRRCRRHRYRSQL